MERVSVLCLSLLLCSLSGAELQDSDIIEQTKVRTESLLDLHAVLREMTAKLAVLQFRVDQLQTLNQEQNAKLVKYEVRMEQLQTLNQEQAAKLKEVDTHQQEQAAKLKEVDTHQQEQAAKLKELENQLDTQQAQASELKSLKTRTNVTENQVESLRRDRAVGQVAFSASLWASGSETLGPINAHTTLEFKHVVSNIGSAYSPNTGFFTAPVRGAYHFEFYIYAYGGSRQSVVGLVKNREPIFVANDYQTNGISGGANGATLLLEAGDIVFLRLWPNNVIFDNASHHTTFSGHLLFPM